MDHQQVPRQHTKKLLPMIEAVLAEAGVTLAELDAIAFGAGPGSFTGLRITAGVAQGLALGADKPLIPVSTLATLAEQAFQRWGIPRVFAGLDARMGELYWAAYERNELGWQAVTAEQVAAPDQVSCPSASALVPDWVGMGPAWQYQAALPEAITARVEQFDAETEPRADAMLALALSAFEQQHLISADQVRPVYLRDQVAWKKSNHREN